MNDKLREAFEGWASKQKTRVNGRWDLQRNSKGNYEKALPMYAWQGYQAGYNRALAELDSPEMVEKVALAILNGLRVHKGARGDVSSLDEMMPEDAKSYRAEAKAALQAIKGE